MRKIWIIIFITIPLFLQSQAGILSFLETNFYTPYLITAQALYDQENYDSALLFYTIPYGISTGNWQHNSDGGNCEEQDHCIKRSLWSLINLRLGQIYYYKGNYSMSELYLLISENSIHNPKKFTLDKELNYYLGLLNNKIYKYEEGLLFFFKSLNQYKKEFGDSSYFVGIILCDIGSIYYNLLNYDKSLEYYLSSMKVLSIQPEKNFSKLSLIANNMGSIYYRLENFHKAISYYNEAISMQERTTPDYYNLSMYYNNVGGIYLSLNNYELSEKYYKKSLSLRLKHVNNLLLLAQSYNQIAVLYLVMGSNQLSLSYVQEAINVNTLQPSSASQYPNPSSNEVLDYWLYGISLYFKTIILNNLSIEIHEESVRCQKLSLSTLKTLLSHFDYVYANHVSESNYIHFLEFNREVLNMAIDLFYASGNISKYQSFDLIERGKSIILFQSIIESKAKEFVGIPQELLEKEKSHKQKINQYELEINIAQHANLDRNNSSDFYNLILSRNREVNSLDSLKEIYQKNFPKYYNLKYSYTGPSIQQIQSKIPDSSALIEYYISDSMLYIAVITNNCFEFYTQFNTELIQTIKDHTRSIKFHDMDQVNISGKLLFKMLIAPIANKLIDIKTITIIPDAELSMLPFETIISLDGGDNLKPRYLIHNYNISYHFSSSLWMQAKGYSGNLTQSFASNGEFLGYAPVFASNQDSKMAYSSNISPLPFTEVELEAIEELYVAKGAKTRTFLNTNATKQSFIEESAKYNIIHLATHGIYNDDNPELSGIAFYNDEEHLNNAYPNQHLSRFDILYVNDTYNLSINADLVVISACMSGVGKKILGEGYMTLYRGFFYAGANNILFSLWNVSDKTASLFMITFYRFIMSGKTYSDALQLTKSYFLENENTSLPIYWSGFLLLGG